MFCIVRMLCVCVSVCVCVCTCVCACMYAVVRIVSMDKILSFLNTFIITITGLLCLKFYFERKCL